MLQHIARQSRGVFASALGQRRKIFARQCLHSRVEPVRRYLYAVLVLFNPDVGIGKSLDDFVELLGGQRQRSGFRDRRRAPAAQADLQVRREQLDLFTIGVDEHVGQNRDRVLAFDNALEQLQFA